MKWSVFKFEVHENNYREDINVTDSSFVKAYGRAVDICELSGFNPESLVYIEECEV